MSPENTQAPREFVARTGLAIPIAFTAGAILFGYGVGAFLGLFPGTGFVIGAVVYVGMAVGAVVVSLTGTIYIWFQHVGRPGHLTKRQVAMISVIAPLFATVAMASTRSLSLDNLRYDLTFLLWTFLGQLVLSVQLFVGSLAPARKRRHVLAAETIGVSGLIATFLAATHDPVSPGSLVFLSGGGAIVFLLFGGIFYQLGASVGNLTS